MLFHHQSEDAAEMCQVARQVSSVYPSAGRHDSGYGYCHRTL